MNFQVDVDDRLPTETMEKTFDLPIMFFESQDSWRIWLSKHHVSSTGIWLKIFKKDSGTKTMVYKEALDTALCYGWIDGQKKPFDQLCWLQKFGPRAPKETLI